MTRCTPRPASALRYDGQRRDEGLALAGLHLGDPAEVQRGAAHDLHVEVALAEHAPAGLAHGRERLGEEVVEQVGDELLAVLGVLARGPRLVDLLAELVGAGRELLVGQALDLGLERVDLGHDRLDRLEARPSPAWRIFLNEAHAVGESTGGAGPGVRVADVRLRPPASRGPRTSPPPCGSGAAASRGCCARGS